ncbi:restriction endonuclease [Nocardia vinacea]|uniref:Restriction endonuclease n=1 Tax=Nocardia vinacea TaxID=96468 RepID=A0ABZ1YN25_9NOCA|nr:restriction endonuclease [Nocardia vinacea]
MDWEKLDWEVFEALVALLMQRVGFVITSPPDQSRGPDTGVDFVVRNANEQDIYVQAKHSRRPPTSSQIRQVAETSRRLSAQLPDAEFFLVSSSDLRPQDRDGLAQAGVTVWDRMYLDRLLESNPDVAQRIEDATEARDLTGLFEEARRTSVPTFADRVAADLATIPPGYQGWKLFEKEAARILTEIFLPDLDPPDTQVRTDDGLDIMDAIYPIPYAHSLWSALRSEFKTRFVVAEFKNHADPIGQREVESICQCMLPKAFRMFGLLVSRSDPGNSAVAARRRAWMDPDFGHGKMIVFLSDEDLIQMAQRKDDGRDPYQVIDDKLSAFLLTLSP